MGKKYELENRWAEFMANAALLCRDIPDAEIGQYCANRLLRFSGGSALGLREVQGTNSVKDPVNKAGIPLKELWESQINLKILKKLDYGNPLEISG